MANEYNQQNAHTQQMPPQQYAQPRQVPQQYAQQQYAQQQYAQQFPIQQALRDSDITTTGQWVVTLLLMAIPIVNLILLLVWAFGSNTKASKQNWARANLVWILIGVVAAFAIVAIATAMGINVRDYIRTY